MFTIDFAGVKYKVKTDKASSVFVTLLIQIAKERKAQGIAPLSDKTKEILKNAVNRQVGVAKLNIRKSVTEVLSGSKNIVKFLLLEKEDVSGNELEGRVNTCMTCPIRMAATDCMSCKGGKALIDLATMIPRLYRPEVTRIRDYFCGACGCSLAILPLVTEKSNLPTDEDNLKPETCWQKKMR